MSKYVTDEAMRSAMTLQKGYIDQGDSNNAEGIDSLKAGKNLLAGVLTGSGPYHNPSDQWGSTSEAVQNPTTLKHEIEVTDGVFSIKEAGDNYIVSPGVGVEKGKTYTFRFYYIDGGGYEIKIIGVGGYNNHQTQGGGGGGISLTFTATETEYVNIFVKTDNKKLMFPQLELGSKSTQFFALTEELKAYIDKGDKANAEGIESIEDRMEEVVQTQLITTPPATLNAQVGYYYCMGGSGVVVDTMTIQLPAIADKNKTKNVQFFMTMGSAPEVTFVSAGTERILYQKDFALEAKRSYEVNALWNGHAWVITVVEIIVPPFVKLSLNNGEVVELQGSGELTSAMVSPYKASLASAEIGELCTSIGSNAFDSCTGLTSVSIPDSVTSIGESAFYNCSGLTSIDLPSGVKNIDRRAFDWCTGLTSVTIPDSVTSIGEWAFRACSGLTSIVVDSGNTVYDSRNNCNALIKTSTNELIAGCNNTIIPNTVTSIGKNAFTGCKGLTSITIPDSVTDIGDNAFIGCSGLTSVSIPDSVTTIGNYAFYNCSGLTSITIPNSVTSIGESAFYNCSKLTSIDIPNSVTSIGLQAFSYCTGLTSVSIPDSVTSIGSNAFDSCTGLTSVSIPDSVTTIGGSAFYNCSGLTSITIPNSVTSIGDYAFAGCSGLTSLTIGNSVTTIGNYAFYNCSGLTSITIPNSVTSIGNSAFYNCSSLTSITCNAITAPTIQSNTFREVKTGGTLRVPSGSTGYNVWMGTGNYYLGKYNWTKVEQ